VTNLPELITGSDQLAAIAARVGAGARIAVDTEFLRERTYLAELALIQIAHGEAIELIDPLAGADLGPLVALLRDPARPKVLHAARQDIEVLLPLTGTPVAPVIDTQLAAALLGHPAQIGYADLVARELGVTLEKGHARTDWTRRPLSPAQLLYAADDVRWLLPLAARLEERLAAEQRLAWLHEDCAALANPALYAVDPAQAWRRLKAVDSLAPREQARVRALAAWRERAALARDLPRGWLLSDEALRTIARSAPADLDALRALGVMPPSAAGKLGAGILGALAEAAGAALDGIEKRGEARPGAAERARLAELGERVRALAAGLSLAPEVLATQRDLRRIARGEPPANVLSGWRAELLSAALGAAARA
jgi:ribonuclease D